MDKSVRKVILVLVGCLCSGSFVWGLDSSIIGVINVTRALSDSSRPQRPPTINVCNHSSQTNETSIITKVSIFDCYYTGGKGKSKYSSDLESTHDVSIKPHEVQAFEVIPERTLYKVSVSVNGKTYKTPTRVPGTSTDVIFDGNTLYWNDILPPIHTTYTFLATPKTLAFRGKYPYR